VGFVFPLSGTDETSGLPARRKQNINLKNMRTIVERYESPENIWVCPVAEVLPQETIGKWVKAKNGGEEKLRRVGNEVLTYLAEAIKRKYFSKENGWEKITTQFISVLEEQNTLLYWTITRGQKKIHLPVVTFRFPDNSPTRFAVDTKGDLYSMGERWLNGGECSLARVELARVDEESGKQVNLLDQFGLVEPGETPPTQLQIRLSDVNSGEIRPREISAYYPDSRFNFSSLGELKWKLQKRTATNIHPQFVIEDLGLLE